MATALDPALTKKTFNNWLKGALAVLFTREALTEFVKSEISDFQRDLLQSIFTKIGIPLGTRCSSCTTANMLRCPTQEFCDKRGKCKLHDPNVPNKSPNQKCPNNICHNIKDAIVKHHRFQGPTWHITDATRWCLDAFQIAKCYLPPKGYDNKVSFDEIDFNGTLGVIINNTRFQNQMTAQMNSCSKVREMINEDIRHSASYELSDIQLAQCIDALRDLLQDSKFLLYDQHAQDAVNKLNQLQSNTLVITAGDITKVLEEDISKRISEQQQEVIQSILDHLAKVQEVSVACLGEIIEARDKAIKAIQQEAEQQRKNVNDVLFEDLKEDIITYYREHESVIPASPLVDEHNVPIEDLYVLPPMWAYKISYYEPSKNTQKGDDKSGNDGQDKQEITISGLFLSGDVRHRKIYITANAGFGKTSLSQKLTMTWCQSHLPLTSLTENYKGDELAAMKHFDLLFLLHLRDNQSEPKCNLDDLIMKMVSANVSRKSQCTSEFIERILHEKKCLVILDGLDEWAHPGQCKRKPEVPHNNHPHTCTVLTTTRDWKIGTIGLSQNHIDRRVEISMLDDETRKQLEKNAIGILNKRNWNLANKNIADFDEAVESVEIGDIIYNPYILLQLMCVFFGGRHIGKSKCEIYSNITEFTLERGLNKGRLPDVQTNDNAPVPNCMNENETCKRYFILLMKLGKLAFYTLFREKKESSLIFDRRIVTQYLTKQEIEFCLKVGLLCQIKDSSIIAAIRYHVFFQHKSIQEFFSAIYITSEWQNESVKSTILNVCSSLSGILEMSNVFVFVCGIKAEVYTCISGELQTIVDLDGVTCTYRTYMYSYNDTVYTDAMRTIKSYQSMQVQCLQESVRNGNDSCPIHLHDYNLTEEDLTTLKIIINFNKCNVKSLQLDLDSGKIPAFMQSLDPGVFTSLETLRVERCDKEPVWLADILTESSRTLKCLILSPRYGSISLSDISITALTRLTCLKSFYLDAVTMTHSNLKCLYAYSSQITTLRQLKLVGIDCSDHEFQNRDCDVTIDLHRPNEWKILELDQVTCRELHVNTACLKKLLFRPRGEKMTSSASATLWQDLRAAPVLSSLELCRLESCEEMLQTIPTLTQLQFLKLADIDMGDLIPKFSPAMTQLERVELQMATMPSAGWREFFLSVGELPRIITVKLSQITMTAREWRELLLSVCILQNPQRVELDMCTGPSDEEWNTIEDEIKSTSLTLVRTSINLPEEILRMDAADIEMYKQLLAEGKEKVYNIRLMIVGHFGVGKTVLTKRLMDQHQDVDISTRIPTEGIDVHVGKMTVNLTDEKWMQQDLVDDDKFLKRKGIVVCEQQITSREGKPDSSKQKSSAEEELSTRQQNEIQNRPNDGDKFIMQKGQDASRQPITTMNDRSSYSEQKTDSTKWKSSPILQTELSHDGDTFVNRKDTVYQQQITTTIYDRSDFSKQELRAKRKLSPKLETESPLKKNEEKYQDTEKSDGEEMETETNQQLDGNISNQNDDSNEYTNEKEIMKIDKMEIKRNEKSADLSIWDFAGQYSFYDTHQVFMSRRTIYLLVTDLSKEPTNVIQEDDCYVDSIGKKQWTALEFLEFWLNAIHECSRKHKVSTDGKQESIDKDDTGPPVILVGTFADKLKDKNVAAADRLKYLEESLNKITASRLVGQHAIDNTLETGGFVELRKTIIDTARKQYYWGESKPARWIQVEIELQRQKTEGVKILKIDKLKTIVKKTIKDDELEIFLKFHHECGNLIYFGEEETLKETIVLDPKWLIDAFKSLNPQRVFATTSHEILNKWLGFDKYGILPQSLINEIWGINIKENASIEKSEQDSKDEKKEFSKYILVYLKKLGLLAEYESSDSKEGKKFYFAPSFIKETIPDQFLISAPNESTTSKLCFTTQSGFLPSAVFNKLLAFCIAKYSLVYDDTTSKYLLFCGCGKFRHELCTLFVYFRKNEIQVWLAYDPKKVEEQSVLNVCKDVMTFVKESIRPIEVILHLKPPQTSVILTDDEFRLEPSLSKTVQTTVVTCKIKYSVVPLQLTKFWFDVSDVNRDNKSENKKGFRSDCKYNGRLVNLADDEKDAIAYSCGAETVFAVLRKIQALKIEGCPITLAIKSIGELEHPENENYVRRKIKASRFHHPFILPIYAIFERKNRFYFVSPDCENGDLKSRLSRSCCSDKKCCSNGAAKKRQTQSCNHGAKKKCDCKLNVAQRIRIAFQVASAIHFLHTPCVYDPNRGSTKTFTVHGSITSNNIVLDGNLNARLIDFKNSYEIDVEVTETATDQTLCESDEQNFNQQNTDQGAKEGNMDIRNDYTQFVEVISELMNGSFTEHWEEMETIRKDIESASTIDEFKTNVVDKLKKLGVEADIMARPEQENDERQCDICMINQADMEYCKDHTNLCRQAMTICSACNYNSHLTSQTCYSCGAIVKPFLGESWGALLIAGRGNDKDETVMFQRDVTAILEVIGSRVIPITKENVETIFSDETEFLSTLKEKTASFSNRDVPPSTMLIYFSCHGKQSVPETGTQTGKTNEMRDSGNATDYAPSFDPKENPSFFLGGSNNITLKSLTEELEKMEHVDTFIIILDRCYAPEITLKRKRVIQICSSSPDETSSGYKTNSFFTKYLVQALQRKSCSETCKICKLYAIKPNDYISVADVFNYVNKHLATETQNPQLYLKGSQLHIAYNVSSECHVRDLEEKLNTKSKK